jgi:hypothetical protein
LEIFFAGEPKKRKMSNWRAATQHKGRPAIAKMEEKKKEELALKVVTDAHLIRMHP